MGTGAPPEVGPANLCLATPGSIPDQQPHPYWTTQQLDPPQCLRDDHISTMR